MAHPSIQFDVDQIRPVRDRGRAAASGTDLDDGIVFGRTVSSGRRSSRSRARSFDRRSMSRIEDQDDEEGIRHPGDIKRKQTFKGTQLFFLAYQGIGVIYGDIGTSPLYVFSGIFSEEPSRPDLIGALSLIIWSLLMMVTLKYILIILHADNEGEGGTFSCYSLLSRYANITNRDPREEPMIHMERYGTNDLHPSNRHIRKTLEQSKFTKGLLKVIGVLAVSMVMSDGVLTPAQSVLGAVQGLVVVKPDISNGTVVGATCGILVALFVIQPFGTTRIGVCFAPIIILWLGLLACFGIYNLALYDAGVFKAFNPGEAFDFLIRNGSDGWRSLGGVLLAFTGVEALFADLGAFSMRAIQISWLGYCLPCLLLTYIGQAAYISVNPHAFAYPVFYTVPNGWVIPTMVIAILAAIVASQAIITATFQLLAQIVKLSYFPPIQVKHTSKEFHNQLYVPLVNYLLCIGTVIITAVFRNTTSLGQAYGVCVMFVTFFDTQMVTLASLIVWRIRPYYVILPWLAFSCMDGAFLSSALTKVPDGAWFTITLAAVLTGVFILWRFGKEQQWRAEALHRKPFAYFVKRDAYDELSLTSRAITPGGETLSITKGFGVFFDKAGDKTPVVFSQYISKLVSKPEVTVFFHLRPIEAPSVPFEERYIVQQIEHLPNSYRVVARYGFMDEVVTPDLAALIYHRIRDYLIRQNARRAGERTSTDITLDRLRPSIDGNEKIDFATRSRPTTAGDGVVRDKEADSSDPSSDNGTDPARPVTPRHKAFSARASSQELSIQMNGESVPLNLVQLEQAFNHRVLYIIGKEEMYIIPRTRAWRYVLLTIFLFVRENTRNKMANLKVDPDRLVEIGFAMGVGGVKGSGVAPDPKPEQSTSWWNRNVAHRGRNTDARAATGTATEDLAPHAKAADVETKPKSSWTPSFMRRGKKPSE